MKIVGGKITDYTSLPNFHVIMSFDFFGKSSPDQRYDPHFKECIWHKRLF